MNKFLLGNIICASTAVTATVVAPAAVAVTTHPKTPSIDMEISDKNIDLYGPYNELIEIHGRNEFSTQLVIGSFTVTKGEFEDLSKASIEDVCIVDANNNQIPYAITGGISKKPASKFDIDLTICDCGKLPEGKYLLKSFSIKIGKDTIYAYNSNPFEFEIVPSHTVPKEGKIINIGPNDERFITIDYYGVLHDDPLGEYKVQLYTVNSQTMEFEPISDDKLMSDWDIVSINFQNGLQTSIKIALKARGYILPHTFYIGIDKYKDGQKIEQLVDPDINLSYRINPIQPPKHVIFNAAANDFHDVFLKQDTDFLSTYEFFLGQANGIWNNPDDKINMLSFKLVPDNIAFQTKNIENTQILIKNQNDNIIYSFRRGQDYIWDKNEQGNDFIKFTDEGIKKVLDGVGSNYILYVGNIGVLTEGGKPGWNLYPVFGPYES